MLYFVKGILLNIGAENGIEEKKVKITYLTIFHVSFFVLVSDSKSESIISPRQLDVGLNIRCLLNSKGGF